MHVECGAYNMRYEAANADVVAAARTLPDTAWASLPVVAIPHGTVLHASIKYLTKAHIDKVVSGAEAFRDNYPIRLYRTADGDLQIVDGHHRVAMCSALRTDMPAVIADHDFVTNALFCGDA